MTGVANAPPPVFFVKAPGTPLPFFDSHMGNGAPGGARVLGAAPLAGMALPAARLRQTWLPRPAAFEAREPSNVGPGASRRSTAAPYRAPSVSETL